jgi:hypothetical protein
VAIAATASLEPPWPLAALAQPEPDDQVTVIWSPQPGPQAHAVSCPVRELFFGGSRGAGKASCWSGCSPTMPIDDRSSLTLVGWASRGR